MPHVAQRTTQRTLIQLSPSTSVVSLPVTWIRKNRLRKGARLLVEERENRIIVSGQTQTAAREIDVDVSGFSTRLVWMAIDAAYTAGYDIISVKTRDQEQTEFMSTVVRYYPGLIIEEERTKFVRLKDIASSNGGTDERGSIEGSESFDKLVQRIHHFLSTVQEDALAAIKSGDWSTLAGMKRRDYTVNTYIALCHRHLSKYGHAQFSKTGMMHSYVKILEILSDKLATLLVGIGTRKIKAGRERDATVQTLHHLLQLYREVAALRTAYSQERLSVVEERRSKMLAALPKLHEHAALYTTEILELMFELEELECALHA